MTGVPSPSVELRDRVLLNVDETAALLGLGVAAVRELLNHDDPDVRLPAFRHGSRWCIPRHQLDGWAATQTTRHQQQGDHR